MNRTELTRNAKAAACQVLKARGYISPVDVLMQMGTLTKENYERWRFRRVPHLEKVLPGSLNKFQFLLRTLNSHARDDLRLKPSRTVYTSWGKGRRQPLRFSKYGNPYLEELYSTHYVSRKLAAGRPTPQDRVAGASTGTGTAPSPQTTAAMSDEQRLIEKLQRIEAGELRCRRHR